MNGIINNYRISVIMLLVMALLVVLLVSAGYAFNRGDIAEELALITSLPWGIVTLIDVYVGFILVSLWILWREGALIRALPWIILIMILGNIISCIYVLLALYRSTYENNMNRGFLP